MIYSHFYVSALAFYLVTLQGHNLLRMNSGKLKRASKCFYLTVEQPGMQAVLLGSTRNFSTTFINGGFVRERSTVRRQNQEF